MRLKRVKIKNFRCLADVEVHFDDVTTLIGPNGVGKSTVLRALDWFFNGSKADPLQDEDCTQGADSDELVVEVEFDSLTQRDRNELGHYVPAGVDRFIAWRFRSHGGTERMTANAKAYEPFSAVRSAGGPGAILSTYRNLREARSDLDLPAARSAGQVEDALRTWELAHPDQLTNAPVDLTTNFFGFNSQAKMAGLFDFVLVTADLRAKEEVLDNRSSIIGRILERTIDRTVADAELAELAARVQESQQRIFERNFQDQLTKISGDLTAAVQQYSGGRTISVSNDNLDVKPPKTHFTVNVSDHDVTTSVVRQGHGFQRTLLISALQLLAQNGTAGDSDGTICMAIEEPELYQHPVQAQAFAEVLRLLAEDQSQSIQVAYATHSPYFIAPGKFHQVRRMTRLTHAHQANRPHVVVKQTSVESVIAKLDGLVKESVIRKQLDSVALHRLPEALFASIVVLVEGTTERAVLEGLANRPGQRPLSTDGIVIADTGSKSSMSLPRAILEELGIPTFLMFDGDKGCEARMRSNNKDERAIRSAVADHIRHNRSLLSQVGAPENDWPVTGIGSSHAVLEDTLESFLHEEWPEWTAAVDNIGKAGLGDPQKNGLLYKDATRGAEGEPPQHFIDLLLGIRTLK